MKEYIFFQPWDEIYKKIKIYYDEDKDERIKEDVDELYEKIPEDIDKIYGVNEFEGMLIICWNNNISADYYKECKLLNGVDISSGDWWVVEHVYKNFVSVATEDILPTEEEPSRVIDRQTRYKVIKRQKWKCNFCQETLKFNNNSSWEGEIAHIDHIHPYSDRYNYVNGVQNINENNNLQALCSVCNLKKSNNKVN